MRGDLYSSACSIGYRGYCCQKAYIYIKIGGVIRHIIPYYTPYIAQYPPITLIGIGGYYLLPVTCYKAIWVLYQTFILQIGFTFLGFCRNEGVKVI